MKNKQIIIYKKECYNEPHCSLNQVLEQINRYRQALSEIKEIAEANKKYIYVLPNYSVAGDSLEFSFEFTKQIIQKINKVEDDLV